MREIELMSILRREQRLYDEVYYSFYAKFISCSDQSNGLSQACGTTMANPTKALSCPDAKSFRDRQHSDSFRLTFSLTLIGGPFHPWGSW